MLDRVEGTFYSFHTQEGGGLSKQVPKAFLFKQLNNTQTSYLSLLDTNAFINPEANNCNLSNPWSRFIR